MGTFTGMSETFLLEVSNDNDLVALAELDLLLFVRGELKAAVTFADSYCTHTKKLKAAVALRIPIVHKNSKSTQHSNFIVRMN